MAEPGRDPEMLDALRRLAALLEVPVEAFEALADDYGRRIARAYLDVDGAANRRALADTVVAIAGTMNIRAAGGR
ncbi:hypothetical protein BHAOGJBA_6043 [Methylobacterium hispanicum]|uniref:Uncharacterized protein n=1 Tax=Methylobacterium hispanicum TaxID=270350 RepID=A0AAV4ZXT1_9HYPH|nr:MULTISPECIES: hypothetical protein [Methylobacterium]GJD92489.1 hypothetical protein BHAOGJBA_6043 [Methylobacterium hispanicum]